MLSKVFLPPPHCHKWFLALELSLTQSLFVLRPPPLPLPRSAYFAVDYIPIVKSKPMRFFLNCRGAFPWNGLVDRIT